MNWWDYWHFPFIQNAFYGGILISILSAILGSLIVVNRLVFISEGLAHCAFGGIGLGLYLGYSPLIASTSFAVGMAFVFSYLAHFQRKRTDTIIGVLMAAGMAIGIILLNLTPGYKTEPINYLFGNILLINKSDIWYLLLFNFVLSGWFFGLYRKILAVSLDPVFMATRGIKTGIYFLTFNLFIAIGVVLSIKMVGLILLLALLTMGPYIMEKYVTSLKAMVWSSLIFNLIIVTSGLFLSIKLNSPSGPTIVILGALIFILDFIIYNLVKKIRRKK